ncbi:hypothetical protein E2C01_004522 [Portunus trituberculatus]|uniref:Uncharacterized protein n=1 Tax=Portunus trituberculatus TaxID=210409 RepID=A0A5B7CU78_PORTR|nr:hypothetical protein [Portunus trituberculatus]
MSPLGRTLLLDPESWELPRLPDFLLHASSLSWRKLRPGPAGRSDPCRRAEWVEGRLTGWQEAWAVMRENYHTQS